MQRYRIAQYEFATDEWWPEEDAAGAWVLFKDARKELARHRVGHARALSELAKLRDEAERLRADRDTRIFDYQRLSGAIRSYLDGEIDREQLEEEWRCP